MTALSLERIEELREWLADSAFDDYSYDEGLFLSEKGTLAKAALLSLLDKEAAQLKDAKAEKIVIPESKIREWAKWLADGWPWYSAVHDQNRPIDKMTECLVSFLAAEGINVKRWYESEEPKDAKAGATNCFLKCLSGNFEVKYFSSPREFLKRYCGGCKRLETDPENKVGAGLISKLKADEKYVRMRHEVCLACGERHNESVICMKSEGKPK